MIKKKDLKNFGFIWTSIFLLIGMIPLYKNEPMRIWALVTALSFMAITLLNPLLLTRFYKLWIRLGEFMGNIVSKVMMFILYFFLFTPIAFVLRFLGKDLLSKKIDRSQKSYWIRREKQPESMKNQF